LLIDLIDQYITDITRLCRRLKLSDRESIRYFIDGLQGDLKAHVSLAQQDTFQQAETLARVKHTVNKQQGVSDSNLIFDKMQTILTQIRDKLTDNTQVVAAASASSSIQDRRYEALSRQIKQLQWQQQHQASAPNDTAVFDSPQGQFRSSQSRNWQSLKIASLNSYNAWSPF